MSLTTGPRFAPGSELIDLAGSRPLYRRPTLALGRPKRRPNIILIVAESTRADALGPDRLGHVSMPFLTQLATRSLVADSAYTTVSHTSKALVGILCGMYARLRMAISEAAPENLPLTCLPHMLNSLGYRTAFMQTARGSFEDRPGLTRNLGFDLVRTREDFKDFEHTGYFGMDEFAMLEPAHEWIAADDAPYFLTLLTVTSHHPYEVPGEEPASELLDDRERYKGSLTHVDRFIEAVYEPLSEKGDFERDTILIVLGDHGEAFGEHQGKQHDVVPYEEVVRVPLIVHGPSWLGEARRVPGLRSHLDLVPSVLDWLQVTHDGDLPGVALSHRRGHQSVMTSCWYDDYCLSLRKGKYKYIYYYERAATEAYDLSADATERTNIASQLPPGQLEEAVNEMLRTRIAADIYYGLLPKDQ